MIFNISLSALGKKGQQLMPFNYQYPLSSVIHAIMHKSDVAFASFFHNVGYGRERYKLFTFSEISVPFTSKGDRMLLLGQNASLKVCFHIPEAAEHFIKGLFLSELLVIGDNNSQVSFRIRNIENSLPNLSGSPNDIVTVIVQLLSPLAVSYPRKEKSAPSEYYSPYEKNFTDRMIFHWIQKYKSISSETESEIEKLTQQIKATLIFFTNPPRERTITIREGETTAQIIRGYTRFKMRLTAPKKMIDLALNSGLGVKNSVGMGCVQLTD